ncbi:hypothetical protein ACX27_03125 [Nostoc piscinale CENA21]|uniref:HNH endonuclease n=1 Tax=Nostoc piscinale CENA21 TaxID=224013 RepID=A0A0M4SI64_9NOSO|nr:hypothetical protein [Nostoc piscinale]ALF52072.1 hypothetical protein ACX27_03125 [Nostoc piscinale CENA21]
MKPSIHKLCPYCCQEKPYIEFNKEHLPAKSLYKRRGKNENADAAIIDVCKTCNNQKSIWDNEILALYGHPTNLEAAIKAQQTLKNPKAISDIDLLTLVMARYGTQTGNSLGKAGGIRLDILSQWMSYVARGIYYFFEREVFRGIVDPRPNVLPYKINSLDGEGCRIHTITELCSIALISKGQNVSLLASVILRMQDGVGWNTFSCFMHKTEEQARAFYATTPDASSKLTQKLTRPRSIYEISKSGDTISYHGIKRVKNNDDTKIQ